MLEEEEEGCFFRGVQYAACLHCRVAMRLGGSPKLKSGCQKSESWRNLGVNFGVIYSFKPQLLGVTVDEVPVCPPSFFLFFHGSS